MDQSTASPEAPSSKIDRATQFVLWLVERTKNDKGMAARLRRADNPATEYQSWEVLASFGIDLTKDYQRIPYATIAAAMARAKIQQNGSLSLGQALAQAFGGNDSDPAKARMRRLLACRSTAELCRVIRPLLTLIDSKVDQSINYADLLNQLLRFGRSDEVAQNVKSRWAMDFYHKPQDASIETEAS